MTSLTEQAVNDLAEQLQEMVDSIHRVHRLRVMLAWAAICYHVEANHEGDWLSQPEGVYCQNEDCKESAEMVLQVDGWLENQRDMLDVPASPHMWEFSAAAAEDESRGGC